VDNFGIPVLPVSLAFTDTPTISSADGEILVSLKPGRQHPGGGHVAALRQRLREQFPNVTIFFQPGDMVNQILDFGLPAPIDVQVIGRNQDVTSQLAQEIAERLRNVRGLADVYVHQVHSAPAIRIDVDRMKANQFGIAERDVAQDALISLSSSGIVYPNYWLSPSNGLTYLLAVQAPPGNLEHADQIRAIPVTGNTKGSFQLLGNVAHAKSSKTSVNISHYGVLPVVDVYANAAGIDLSHATVAVQKIIAEFETKLPRGTSLAMRGQAKTMEDSFSRLGYGFLLAVLLVFLLLVITFQSLSDAATVLLVVPGALAGALLALIVTGTTLSIPALLGSLMSIGVGTANGILLITFARERLEAGINSSQAVLEASVVRLRPILMTACAMLCGMLPIALGLGEGAEQNAPLGRAAFGGLLGASLNVLVILPIAFSAIHRRHKQPTLELDTELLHG
jgi:multidrug efflux pump subunit AcrB